MIYIVLPAYNEEADLPALLDEFTATTLPGSLTLVVINDGSTDGTAGIVESFRSRLPLTVLTHAENRGLGRALMTGFLYAAEHMAGDDLLVTMDADHSHPAVLINKLAEGIAAGTDVVIASRFREGGTQRGVPPIRRMLSGAAGALLRLIRPIAGVTDYTSGYRAFSSGIVHRLTASYGTGFITESSFAATLEILLKAADLKASFAEIPLPLRYDRKSGKSKMRIGATITRYVVLVGRLLRSRARF